MIVPHCKTGQGHDGAKQHKRTKICGSIHKHARLLGWEWLADTIKWFAKNRINSFKN
jgi:hypothetical protein